MTLAPYETVKLPSIPLPILDSVMMTSASIEGGGECYAFADTWTVHVYAMFQDAGQWIVEQYDFEKPSKAFRPTLDWLNEQDFPDVADSKEFSSADEARECIVEG